MGFPRRRGRGQAGGAAAGATASSAAAHPLGRYAAVPREDRKAAGRSRSRARGVCSRRFMSRPRCLPRLRLSSCCKSSCSRTSVSPRCDRGANCAVVERNRSEMFAQAPRSAPRRTGRYRVRWLRSSFNIATLFRELFPAGERLNRQSRVLRDPHTRPT